MNEQESIDHLAGSTHYCSAVNDLLTAGDSLAEQGQGAMAEIRYKQAVQQAELIYGMQNPILKRVLVSLMMFYLGAGRTEEAASIGNRLAALPAEGLTNAKPNLVQPAPNSLAARLAGRRSFSGLPAIKPDLYIGYMPREVHKACQVLGLGEESLTVDLVMKAWKAQVVTLGAHPDLGGRDETSVIMNTAKDSLITFLESRSNKLGKRFEANAC